MLKGHGNVPAILVALALSTPGAVAQDAEVATTYDDEWITLSGEVERVLGTKFKLDYGENDITVEMDRFDWLVDRSVLPGDHVTVTGRMDKNLYDMRSIEAATVYVPRLNEYIYADPDDEEGDASLTWRYAPGLPFAADDGDWLRFSGRVMTVSGDEITVDTGVSTLRVDTSPIPGWAASPAADVGDRVLVSGEMDAAGLFDRREVEASSVTKLSDRSS